MPITAKNDPNSILVIDIGSTSMKAVLHDSNGAGQFISRRDTRPEYLADKQVQMDAGRLKANLLSLLSESYAYIQDRGAGLLAISVTSQRSSVVPVDAAGEPLAPVIMWHDKRTVPLCEKLAEHNDRVFSLAGLPISPVYSAIKMLWIKRHLPEVYQKTAKMLGIHDFALHTLCGGFCTDHSLASSTNLLNLRTLQWDSELLQIFNIDKDRLCGLAVQGSICGKTTAELSRLTGIPCGTPVVTAGGDQQSGALGQGVLSIGKMKHTTGTGSYLLAYADQPVIDPQQRFQCKVGAVPGTYCLEAGTFTAGAVYRWFFEQFYKEAAPDKGFMAINQEAAQSRPGASGVLMLPHFAGSGAPSWNPLDTGVFYNISLSTTRADMARSILEGILLESKQNLRLFEESLGKAEQISAAGGLTQFSFYNQLQADILGAQIMNYPNPEASALGAWISAAVACGLFESHEKAFQSAQVTGEEKMYTPRPGQTDFYNGMLTKRKALHRALESLH